MSVLFPALTHTISGKMSIASGELRSSSIPLVYQKVDVYAVGLLANEHLGSFRTGNQGSFNFTYTIHSFICDRQHKLLLEMREESPFAREGDRQRVVREELTLANGQLFHEELKVEPSFYQFELPELNRDGAPDDSFFARIGEAIKPLFDSLKPLPAHQDEEQPLIPTMDPGIKELLLGSRFKVEWREGSESREGSVVHIDPKETPLMQLADDRFSLFLSSDERGESYVEAVELVSSTEGRQRYTHEDREFRPILSHLWQAYLVLDEVDQHLGGRGPGIGMHFREVQEINKPGPVASWFYQPPPFMPIKDSQ